MILSDERILEELGNGNLVIKPFDLKCLGSNSYDVHLFHTIAEYKRPYLDCKKYNEVEYTTMPECGFMLYPNRLYLGSSVEYTETHGFVPILEGKSSLARLGMCIHLTAGKGDEGFCNHWTLEITVIKPLIVYPNMPIGQLIYFALDGEVRNSYKNKVGAKYNEVTRLPMESQMYKNF